MSTSETTPETTPETNSETKSETTPQTNSETTPETKMCAKLLSMKKSLRKAIKCFSKKEYSLASAYFCVAFKLSTNRQLSHKWKSTFLYAFDRHISHLELFADNQTIINAFDEAIDAFPDCEDIHYNQGIYYYKKGFLSKAVTCFVYALSLNPNYHLSHLCLENIKASSIARWHFIMINDIKRNTAFKNAIFKAVNNGYNNVLDIGSGSGLLSLYALEAGAEEVYACEVSEMLCHMCKDVFESNKVVDKVVLFNDMSTNIRIPEMIAQPVSLVVTEIFDAALFGEHVLTTIHSALKNLLDPNHGIVIPNNARVYGILLESEELRDCFILNNKYRSFGNIVISDDISICVNSNEVKYTTINLSKIVNKKYLSERFEIININFNDIHQIETLLQNDYQLSCSVNCTSVGILDAIAIWFDLNLIDDINISTEPPSELIGWEQAIYPAFETPVSVEPNTTLCLSFNFNEDYLKLSQLYVSDHSSDNKMLKKYTFNLEVIKYLNSHNFHESFIEAIEGILEKGQILNIIDMTYFPVSSLHSLFYPSLEKLMIVTDDNEIKDNISTFIKATKTRTDKIKLVNFQNFMENNQSVKKALVLTDLIESTGLMRSNILEKLAYLKIYIIKSPVFVPFKICIKAVLIQSEDLISRSRLTNDDNVHGYKIKEFLNIFETETLQNIDLNKIQIKELSDSFDLLEINLNESVESDQQINVEPSNKCSVSAQKSGQLHAVLYWYELHLTEEVIVSSLKLGPNWNSAAFIVKESLKVNNSDKIHINCMFTNGFLRLKLSPHLNH